MIYTTEELLAIISFYKSQATGTDGDRLDAIADILRDAEPRVLTVEELRKMDGQKVTISVKKGSRKFVTVYQDGKTMPHETYNKTWGATHQHQRRRST